MLRYENIKKITLFFSSIFIALLLLEFFVRTIIDDGMNLDIEMAKYAKDLKIISKNKKIGIEHQKNKEGYYMGVRINLNSLGFRNDYEYELEKKNVLMLGDSMTLGWGASKTFSNYLQSLTNNKIKFHNAGIGNTNTIMQINNFFENYDNLNFDTIILNFFINDLEKVYITDISKIKKNSQLYIWINLQIKRILMRLSNTYHWSDFYKKTFENNEILNETIDEINKLNNFCIRKSISFYVNFIPELRDLKNYNFNKETNQIKTLLKKNNIKYYDSINSLKEYEEIDLWVSKNDSHANNTAHKIIADFLFQNIFKNELK